MVKNGSGDQTLATRGEPAQYPALVLAAPLAAENNVSQHAERVGIPKNKLQALDRIMKLSVNQWSNEDEQIVRNMWNTLCLACTSAGNMLIIDLTGEE